MVPSRWRQVRLSGKSRRTLHVFWGHQVTCFFGVVDVLSGIKRGRARGTFIAQGELVAPLLAIFLNLTGPCQAAFVKKVTTWEFSQLPCPADSRSLGVDSLLAGLHLLSTVLKVTSLGAR